MTTVSIGNTPAVEAIEHFRQKVKVPTQSWTQLMGAANAHAFTVAGATKVDLLNDLQGAVAAALENGESIGQFRKRFDDIVQLHGWEYKGKRGWRTRVIYDNNLRTAHMAGRWQQIQRTKQSRPFLIYVTVNDNRVRDEHRQWHHLVLPVDDRWWDTHYPPNGWGCRCTIRTANEKQLERQGLSVARRPPLQKEQRTSTRSGEDFGLVPKGIDTGWDYNPGKAWLGPDIALGERLAKLPDDLLQTAWQSLNTAPRNQARLAHWQQWLKDRSVDEFARGHLFNVGHLSPPLLKTINRAFPKVKSQITAGEVANTSVVVADSQIAHLAGQHKDKSKRFLPEWLDNLPAQIADYKAVLLHKSRGTIVLVLRGQSDGKTGRIVVEINALEKGKVFNSIRSLGVVKEKNLRAKDYELLDGEI